jgi:hypothetical protein
VPTGAGLAITPGANARLVVDEGAALVVESGGTIVAGAANSVAVDAAGALVVDTGATVTVNNTPVPAGAYAGITDVSEGLPPSLTEALVAELGGESYASASGPTVTLSNNDSISSSVTVPLGVTLDTDTFTLTVSDTLTVNGTLTVKGVLAGSSGTLDGSGHVILAGPDGADESARTVPSTTGIFTFEGTQSAAFGANSPLSLANAIANADDGKSIVILGNIGNNNPDTNGFHLYSIVEKTVTVTQAVTKPYTIYGSIYVYGDSDDAVTLSNLKIETLKIAVSGYSTDAQKKEKPFLSSIGGMTDNLTVTGCNLKVSSIGNGILTNGGVEPIYSGMRILPLTNEPTYSFTNNTIEGLKSAAVATGIIIGTGTTDVADSNWYNRYPMKPESYADTTAKNALKAVDFTGKDLFTNFFSVIEGWNNTITGFDNEAVFQNALKLSGNVAKVYFGDPLSYSVAGLADALDWGNDVSTEVYLATTASVEDNLEINATTTLIIKAGVTLTITGNLTATDGAKIQLGAGSHITFTGSADTALNGGKGNYTYSGSAWAEDV